MGACSCVMLRLSLLVLGVSVTTALGVSEPTTVVLNNGKLMPRINLGTCCGSKPSVGLSPWIQAGGVGIDTAWDYQDQADIKKVLSALKENRDKVFITTKLPVGLSHDNATNCSPDPKVALAYVQENLRELGVDYVDLVLLHGPCEVSQPPVS